jgi:Tfp pilus assembly PilM family ATPase
MKKRHYYTYPPTALELSQHWFAFVTIKKTKDELNIQKSIVKQIREDFIPYSLGNITTLKSEEIKRFISGIFNEYTISLKRLSLAIPDSLAYIFVFQDIPENTRSKEAITEFIRWKVEKKLPFNFKEAIIGFQCFIDFNEKNLLAVISPANIIRQFEEIFSSLGIHVGLIVPSSFALINFYHHLLSHRNDNKEYLFINLSDYYISFFIIQGQRPILFRTKNLINKEEVRKGDYSFLIEQVRFTLLYYQNRFQKEEDLSIYLGGVSPAVRNFKSLIESTLDLKVDIITPSANKKLKVFSEESEERIYFLSSAIGM